MIIKLLMLLAVACAGTSALKKCDPIASECASKTSEFENCLDELQLHRIDMYEDTMTATYQTVSIKDVASLKKWGVDAQAIKDEIRWGRKQDPECTPKKKSADECNDRLQKCQNSLLSLKIK